MHPLTALAQNLTREIFGNKLEIGRCFIYRKDGEGEGVPVQIVDGQFMSNGRLSNFWYWKRVKPDGTLSRRRCCGYGGDDPFFTPITLKKAKELARGKQRTPVPQGRRTRRG